MATKQRKGEKKPLTALMLSGKTQRGAKDGKFYRLRDGVFVKLAGAPKFWDNEPNLIYLVGYYWVGNYNEIYYALQLQGNDDNAIKLIIDMYGITSSNYQSDKAQLFNETVKDHKRANDKSATQKRIEDKESYVRLAAYRELKERSGKKSIGTIVDSEGRPSTSGTERGARQYTMTLQQRVDKARMENKLVNVNKILEANAIDSQGRIQKAGMFPLKDMPVAGKERDYRHVPGLNITANNLAAYQRAADILGATPQMKDAIRAQFAGSGPILSPGMQQLVGRVPQFDPQTSFAPTFSQPVVTQPVTTLNQIRQIPPATLYTAAAQPAQFTPVQSQFAPMPAPILPRQPSPVRQTISPVAPRSPSRMSPQRMSPSRMSPSRVSPSNVTVPILPPASSSPPRSSVGASGLPQSSSPRVASPTVAPVRLSPRTSPRAMPTQTLGVLSSPGRSVLPMPSQLQ